MPLTPHDAFIITHSLIPPIEYMMNTPLQPQTRLLAPLSQEAVGLMVGEAARRLTELVEIKPKDTNTLTQISHLLEETLELEYFRLLRSKLAEAEYHVLIERLGLAFKERDSIVIEKRKKNDYFYVIVEGTVDILDEQDSSPNLKYDPKKFHLINQLGPGGTFGETSITSSKREASARVVAKTPLLLILIDFEVFSHTAMKVTVARKQEIANVLMASPIFYGIHQDSIKDLATGICQLKVGFNTPIYQPGERHDCLYFVKQGLVELSCNGIKLVTLGTGESFGVEVNQFVDTQRRQLAVSKSRDLVLYRILFGRFKSVHSDVLEKISSNLTRDFNTKTLFYQNMLNKSTTIERLVTNSKTSQKKRFRKRKVKGKSVQLVPEWWGTVSKNHADNKLRKFSAVSDKENFKPSGLLGAKRINILKEAVSRGRQPEECLSVLVGVGSNGFQSSFPKKEVRRNISNMDGEHLKRKMVPLAKKEKLLSYAKSSINGCESIFII